MLHLLPALREVGVDAQMAGMVVGQGQEFLEAMRTRGVPVHRLAGGRHDDPRSTLQLIRLFRRLRPDLVHTHLIDADVYGQTAARLTGIPAVSSVHGVPTFYQRWPYHAVGRAVGRLPKRRIAISDHVRRFLVEHRLSPAERITVIPYGIDAAAWRPRAGDREQARRRWGLDDDVVVIGMAARMIEGKGHATLLNAAQLAAGRGPRLHLLLAGDGALRPSLEQTSRSICRQSAGLDVDFLGHIEDVPSFMHASDIVVFPTQPPLGEGFGLAALEAQAAGRPVIASDWCSLPEVVEADRTGLLFPPGSATALAHALATLASDRSLRERLGAQGAVRAATIFPPQRTVRSTVEVYDAVLARTGN